MAVVSQVNCLLQEGFETSQECNYSLPQIVELYLANFAEVTDTTVAKSTDSNGEEVTVITMKSGAKWYKVEPAGTSANWSDNLGEGGSGNHYRIQSVSFSVNSAMKAGLAEKVDALSLGKYIAVARMADGGYIMLGRLAGLKAGADGANISGSGDATAEGGLVVTLSGNAVETFRPLSESAKKTVLGTAETGE